MEFKELTILIVENDIPSVIILTKLLNGRCKKIYHVDSGKKAIDLCIKTPDIDLILMDIRMPEMDGHMSTKKIREFNKDVIIIAQTVLAYSTDREDALAAGCNDYISKPLNHAALFEMIVKLTENHRK